MSQARVGDATDTVTAGVQRAERSAVRFIGSLVRSEPAGLVSFSKNSRHVGTEEKLVECILKVGVARIPVGRLLSSSELVPCNSV